VSVRIAVSVTVELYDDQDGHVGKVHRFHETDAPADPPRGLAPEISVAIDEAGHLTRAAVREHLEEHWPDR
jgi:hypothetical protein